MLLCTHACKHCNRLQHHATIILYCGAFATTWTDSNFTENLCSYTMFSGAAKIGVGALTGTADNCECVPREKMESELSFQYLLHGEKPYIFLKSAKEDHIFTDQAYIAVRGQTAGGAKRLIVRADYSKYSISDVMLETGGMGLTDQDCELKFTIAHQAVSVDIKKSEQHTAILYYRALCSLAHAQARHAQHLMLFKDVSAKTTFQITDSGNGAVAGTLQAAQTANFENSSAILSSLLPLSYKSVFEQYAL